MDVHGRPQSSTVAKILAPAIAHQRRGVGQSYRNMNSKLCVWAKRIGTAAAIRAKGPALMCNFGIKLIDKQGNGDSRWS